MAEFLEKKKRVLIVEDDLIISLVIENMVKKLGHVVIGKAVSGEDAISLALEHNPNIILMDIRIKGDIDGIEAINSIKENIPVSVIYLTGNSDKINFERAKATEFTDLITKPFTFNDLTKSFELV